MGIYTWESYHSEWFFCFQPAMFDYICMFYYWRAPWIPWNDRNWKGDYPKLANFLGDNDV